MSNIQYVQTQTKITNNTSLSCQARITYQVLVEHCHSNKITCYPSLSKIAFKVGKSTRSIIRYINELVSAGLVKRINRGHHSNLYILTGLISYDETLEEMVELNESNCTKEGEESSPFKKAMDKVKSIVKRNTKPKTYNSKKKKDTAGECKDEYAPDINKIREQMRSKAKGTYEEIKDKYPIAKEDDTFPLDISEDDLPF